MHCAVPGRVRRTYTPQMRRGPSVQIVACAIAALGLAAASCSSDKAKSPTTLVAETVPVLTRADDGVLTIGVLSRRAAPFPTSASRSSTGQRSHSSRSTQPTGCSAPA